MKEKTKEQLRKEISTLRIERDAASQHFGDILFALAGAVRATLTQSPDDYEVFATFATMFFAELKRKTGVDYASDKLVDGLTMFTDFMGFDEVTSIVIKQEIQPFYEIGKMVFEGKSKKELQEFVKTLKERRKKR